MTSSLSYDRLAVLVHESRSIVAALSAVAETAADTPADEVPRRQLVRLALSASRAIERIVVDLAVASVHVEPVDVGLLVRDAVAAFSIRGANVAGEGDDGRLLVNADPVRLRQVLDNLIANALDHAGSDVPVTVRAATSRGGVEIAVSDLGPGIPQHELARVFELGVRLDSGTEGSGLGLALSRAIVDAHGGTIVAESTPGEGSTFTIVLPGRSRQPAT